MKKGEKFEPKLTEEDSAKKDGPIDKVSYDKFEYNPLQMLKDESEDEEDQVD